MEPAGHGDRRRAGGGVCGRAGSRRRAGRRGRRPHRGTSRRHARGQGPGRVSRVSAPRASCCPSRIADGSASSTATGCRLSGRWTCGQVCCTIGSATAGANWKRSRSARWRARAPSLSASPRATAGCGQARRCTSRRPRRGLAVRERPRRRSARRPSPSSSWTRSATARLESSSCAALLAARPWRRARGARTACSIASLSTPLTRWECPTPERACDLLEEAERQGFDALLAEHRDAWATAMGEL